MYDGTPSSQGSKTSPGRNAGCPSPELENVPLSPAASPGFAQPHAAQRRPGAMLASPMVLLSRGWLRRHRPVVLITAAAIGAALLVVLLAAVGYHVTPPSVSVEQDLKSVQDLESEEGSRDLERPLGHHNKAGVAKAADEGGDTAAPTPQPVDHIRRDESRDAAVVYELEVAESPPRDNKDLGSVLRAAVVRSQARSRRHRTGSVPPLYSAKVFKTASPCSSGESERTSRATVVTTVEPQVKEQSRVREEPVAAPGDKLVNRQWRWAAVPHAPSYAVELDEIRNSVSEVIHRGIVPPTLTMDTEYAQETPLKGDGSMGGVEQNWAVNDVIVRKELLNPNEGLAEGRARREASGSQGRKESTIATNKITDVRHRERRSLGHLHVGKSDSLLQGLNERHSSATSKKRLHGDRQRFLSTPHARNIRQIYSGPYFDSHSEDETMSVEDYSSEGQLDMSFGQYSAPYSWYYRPHGTPPHYHTYFPYDIRDARYFPRYPSPQSYYSGMSYAAQPGFDQMKSFKDNKIAPISARRSSELGNRLTATKEQDFQGKQINALRAAATSPLKVSPEFYSRAQQSKTPQVIADNPRDLSQSEISSQRHALADENKEQLQDTNKLSSPLRKQATEQFESKTVVAKPSGVSLRESSSQTRQTGPSSGEVPQQGLNASQKETAVAAAESSSSEASGGENSEDTTVTQSNDEKLFTGEEMLKLVKNVPAGIIAKLLRSLSTQTVADLMKGFTEEDLATLKDSLLPEELKAIKKVLSPKELKELKDSIVIKSNQAAKPAVKQPARKGDIDGSASIEDMSEETTKEGLDDSKSVDISDNPVAPQTMVGVTVGPRLQPSSAASASPMSLDKRSAEVASGGGSSGVRRSAPASAAAPRAAEGVETESTDEGGLAEDERARSYFRTNSSTSRRPWGSLLREMMMTTMSSTAAVGAMSGLAAQDGRVGREMDAGNPLDALTADRGGAVMRALRVIAEDVRWLRMHFGGSNASEVGTSRSSLMQAQLRDSERTFAHTTSVAGPVEMREDSEHLAALPTGLFQDVEARYADTAISSTATADYPTALGSDYASAVEATASSSYTVSSPAVDATTVMPLIPEQPASAAGQDFNYLSPNYKIMFPSQTAVDADETPQSEAPTAPSSSGLGKPLVPLPVPAASLHIPVCFYATQPQPPASFPRQVSAQASAYAAAVAFIPEQQGSLDKKNSPVLHHQHNVYNYYTGVPSAGNNYMGMLLPNSSPLQQPSVPYQQHLICRWVPSAVAQPVPHIFPVNQPHVGWRFVNEPGVGASADFQESVLLPGYIKQPDEMILSQQSKMTANSKMNDQLDKSVPQGETLTGMKMSATENNCSNFTKVNNEQELKHSTKSFRENNETLNGSPDKKPPVNEYEQLLHPNATAKQTADVARAVEKQSEKQGTPEHSVRGVDNPFHNGVTEAVDKKHGAKYTEKPSAGSENLRSGEQLPPSDIHALQGTHTTILSGLSATPSVPVLSHSNSSEARNR